MPKKLPKGIRQIAFQEKRDLSRGSGKLCGHESGTYADKAGSLCRICVLQSNSRDIEENLAAEEELVQQAEQGVLCLLFWRNEDCVVIGRHQNPEAECHLDALKKMGVRIARRRTGGGAVFQDMGNLNVSFIAPADSLDEQICEGILLRALEKCGVQARKTGRNDLVIDDVYTNRTEIAGMVKTDGQSGTAVPFEEGGKFSGSASWQTPGGNLLFHATLMFDVDLDKMKAALNASPGKLARHGIASVRARVSNLKEHYPDLKMKTVIQAIITESAAILSDVK